MFERDSVVSIQIDTGEVTQIDFNENFIPANNMQSPSLSFYLH